MATGQDFQECLDFCAINHEVFDGSEAEQRVSVVNRKTVLRNHDLEISSRAEAHLRQGRDRLSDVIYPANNTGTTSPFQVNAEDLVCLCSDRDHKHEA